MSFSIWGLTILLLSDMAAAQDRQLASLNEGNARQRAQVECLTEALYFEARGESELGQVAVADVILNRVASRHYPNTICEVVKQGASRKSGCQFSYNCDGLPNDMRNKKAYRSLRNLAQRAIAHGTDNVTKGATHYHTVNVRPNWASSLRQTRKIGVHLFYRAGARG